MWRDGGQGDATENGGEDVDEVRDWGVKGPAVEEEGSRRSRRQFSGKGPREEPRPVCVRNSTKPKGWVRLAQRRGVR